eukprot:m.75729 g.75729  ORF g.75729 m.75729 type:complete len:537 (+) comp10441_c0_seq1:1-1611(+)
MRSFIATVLLSWQAVAAAKQASGVNLATQYPAAPVASPHDGLASGLRVKTPPPPPPIVVSYSVDPTDPENDRQVIEGLGFEIQADSIGSGVNPAVGAKISGVPHDLTLSERERLNTEMLRGFRTCRLALGLYVRGLDPSRQRIIGRWPTQMAELKALQDGSGVDGFDVEYWSPAPYWKGPEQNFSCSTGDSNAPRWSTKNVSFLAAWSDAMAADAAYLMGNGLRIKYWGLQNEPENCPVYAGLKYTNVTYYDVFNATAPKIFATVPGVKIEGGSLRGCEGVASAVYADPNTRAMVTGGWTYHTGGAEASSAMRNYSAGCGGATTWVNEWEYFGSLTPKQGFNLTADDTINLAATVLNWFVFSNAPKFTFLHALKPTYNVEAEGFGLGFWRPPDDNSTQKVPLDKGHWRFNNKTWNALAGFTQRVPWDSTRVHVVGELDPTRVAQRIMAFRTPPSGTGGPHHLTTPGGRLGFVLINTYTRTEFVARVNITGPASGVAYSGYRYNATTVGAEIGVASVTHGVLEVTVPPLSIEFWLGF